MVTFHPSLFGNQTHCPYRAVGPMLATFGNSTSRSAGLVHIGRFAGMEQKRLVGWTLVQVGIRPNQARFRRDSAEVQPRFRRDSDEFVDIGLDAIGDDGVGLGWRGQVLSRRRALARPPGTARTTGATGAALVRCEGAHQVRQQRELS
jgi:hypothetical protein